MYDNSPTADVDRLLAEADAIRYGDKVQIIALAQAASQGAQQLGDFRRYADALLHQAWAYGMQNQYEYSLTYALEALALTRSYGFDDLEARAVGVIAVNFLKCGIWQEAQFLYQHLLAMGEQLGIPYFQAAALTDLAIIRMEENDPKMALDYLRRAVSLMPKDTHGGIDYAHTVLNLAFAYLRTGQLDDAVEQSEIVLSLTGNVPHVAIEAHVCITLVHMGRDEFEAAERQIAIARAITQSVDPPIYSANVDGLTADLLQRTGRYGEAIEIWEDIIENLLERQEIDGALNALEYAKKAYEHIEDKDGLLRTYKRLAEDVPRLQKKSGDLRFSILRMVFAMDKASLQAELQLSQQKNAILRRLSHEFRTPLSIIQSSTDIVKNYGERLTLEQRQERLAKITAQVHWLTVMLDDILELLRFDENDAAPLSLITFRLEELAQGALAELERYRVPSVRIRVDIQPETVTGARKALQTVLVHLLTNAVKFSQDTVMLELFVEGRALIMRVSDQGIGILPDEQAEIFKPLVRGSNLDEVTGNGLGLAIVARLVAQMHGSIDLTSAVGNGTIITLNIPL